MSLTRPCHRYLIRCCRKRALAIHKQLCTATTSSIVGGPGGQMWLKEQTFAWALVACGIEVRRPLLQVLLGFGQTSHRPTHCCLRGQELRIKHPNPPAHLYVPVRLLIVPSACAWLQAYGHVPLMEDYEKAEVREPARDTGT